MVSSSIWLRERDASRHRAEADRIHTYYQARQVNAIRDAIGVFLRDGDEDAVEVDVANAADRQWSGWGVGQPVAGTWQVEAGAFDAPGGAVKMGLVPPPCPRPIPPSINSQSFGWWGGRGSNPRPRDYESPALTG